MLAAFDIYFNWFGFVHVCVFCKGCTQMWSLLNWFCLEFTELLGPVSSCLKTILGNPRHYCFKYFCCPILCLYCPFGCQSTCTLDWLCPTGLKCFFLSLCFTLIIILTAFLFSYLWCTQFTVKATQWFLKFQTLSFIS